jgi:hypothetical protein
MALRSHNFEYPVASTAFVTLAERGTSSDLAGFQMCEPDCRLCSARLQASIRASIMRIQDARLKAGATVASRAGKWMQT